MSSLSVKKVSKGYDMINFLNKAWSPFHAVNEVKNCLLAEGYLQLKEYDSWNTSIKSGGKYFFTRNSSTITAFSCTDLKSLE